MIVLIDNYDSFVFNLARYCQELGCETRVVRNDEITAEQLRDLNPQAILLSPGPCTPNESGNCLEIIRQLSAEFPMLGVCLGHQALAAAFGGKIVKSPEPVHGQTALVRHDHSRLFGSLPNPLTVTRYHSLLVDEESLPGDFKITARTEEGLPMAIEHQTLPLFGVQFHPESILTEQGHALLGRFLQLAGCEITTVDQSELKQAAIDLFTELPETPITPGPVCHWRTSD